MHQWQVRPLIPEPFQPLIIRVHDVEGRDAVSWLHQISLFWCLRTLNQRINQGRLLLVVLQPQLSIYLLYAPHPDFDWPQLFIWTVPMMDASKPFYPWLCQRGSCYKKNPTNNELTLTEAPADGKHNQFQSPNLGSCVATLNSCVFFQFAR